MCAATGRVFVGAIVELAASDEDLRTWTWHVDVQVNNARTDSVTITGYVFDLVDANGKLTHTLSDGLGENQNGVKQDAITLAPGSALRLKTQLPPLGTSTARIEGKLFARFDGKAGGGSGSGGDDDADGDADGDGDGNGGDEGGGGEGGGGEGGGGRLVELLIGPLGASVDGSRVKPYEVLGFLQPQVV